MRGSLCVSRFSRIAGAIAAFWLCGVGAAWAGDGGEDLTGLNSFISSLCSKFLNIPTTSCPQLPTITQAVLEIAALENAPLELARSLGAAGPAINVGNP